MTDERHAGIAPVCIATVTTRKAIDNLLETGTKGAYRDRHPWIVARELFEQFSQQEMMVPLMLAVDGEGELELSHWAPIVEIEALELHRGQWDSICRFGPLRAVNPIWRPLDSVCLAPTPEQLRREQVEGLQMHRHHLQAQQIRPYAICETPPFLAAS